VVSADDSETFTRFLKVLILDKDLRKQMAESAVVRAREFSLEKMLSKTTVLYDKLLGQVDR